MKYGLYYMGYKDETFFWQVIIINLRRIAFIGLSVGISRNSKKNLVIIFIITL